MVEPLKNHSTSCVRDRAWTARAEGHARKRCTITRERKNQGREGRPNLKKGGRMANKVEKEISRKNKKKRAKRAFEIFFEGFSFSTLSATPSSFFSDSIVPLFLGSSFSSLLFSSLFHDLQPLLSRPCAWHMMWNDS